MTSFELTYVSKHILWAFCAIGPPANGSFVILAIFCTPAFSHHLTHDSPESIPHCTERFPLHGSRSCLV